MDQDKPKPAPGPLALVQDFVNTRNYLHGGDLLGEAEQATRSLTARGLLQEGESIGESERRRLVSLREALRGLLLVHSGAAEPGPDAEDLNSLVTPTALGVRFRADGHPALEPAAEDSAAERVVARLLAEVIWAEAQGKWERLKSCRNEGCRWAFYDTSKNRSGRWCNMDVCGARHKMRTYRKRKSETR
jgi:predicted RNA-binding Zn ribbon-like protein